jgi:hypothetical protein
MHDSFPVKSDIVELTPDQKMAAAYDTCDDAIIIRTEEMLIKTDLINLAEADLRAAKAELDTVCQWLVSESLDDGDPTRDITLHPEYQEAFEAYTRMREIVDQLKS